MNPRRHVRLLVASLLIAGLLAAAIGTVIQALSFSPRSIEGQDGWSGGTIPISASIDQIIDQSGVNQRTGTGAWRISNNTSLGNYNGNFAGWVFGPGLPVSAGQPSSGAVADQFTATLWFRSASAVADGSNIEVDLGSDLGNDRNNFLALTNRADGLDGGLQLRASEPDGATGNFRPTQIIATGITRGVYHRLDIIAKFLDGPANDTVEYALDGVPLANPLGGMTFGTFEGWRDGLFFTYVLSNRLYFRSGAPPSTYGAFADTAAQGFFFDDLFYAVADQSTPAIRLAAYATGFEPGFSAGSIEGQESWSGGTIPIAASVDQAVDLAGLNQRTGTGAWRISNNTSLGGYNGNFAGWVFGPGLPVTAGQPSSGAVADQFTATLWFRSASAVADGSNIEVDLGSDLGNDRNNFLALTNRADGLDGGLQLRASEPDGATGNFRPTQIIATGITRGVYHRLDIIAKFFDGPANDTVEYVLDGVPLANPLGGTTFGTFEGWRDGLFFTYVLSNRLYFRSGAPPSTYGAFVDTAAQGFFFDDLFYAVALQSAPATPLAAYATGFEPPAIPAPDLTISKSHVGDFTQGQIGAQFTVTVTNSGTPSTIGVVTLTDDVPPGLTPTAATGAGWTCGVNGAMVNCSRSDPLAPGASYEPVTITVNVAANAPASVANTATISGGGDVDTANNTATDVTTITPGPDLIVSKSHAGNFTQGQTGAQFTVTVTNSGGSPTSDSVTLVDNLPAGLTPTAASGAGWTCGVTAPAVTCTRSDALAPGASYGPVTITVNVAASAPASVTNTATISGGGDVNTANNTATDVTTITPGPDLIVSKSHAGNFTQGQTGAQFTVTVTNSGGSPTSGSVTLVDNLPAGLTPTAASGAGWTCGVTAPAVTCTRSDALAPAASYPPVTISVNVAASAPASVTNTATISGGGDVDTTNNTATDVITILPGALQVDLAVTKTDGQTTYLPGTAISYTITVTNAGPSTAAGFSSADNVPAAITGVTVTCVVTGTGNCGTNGSSGNSVSFTAASLAPGAGNMLTLTVNGSVSPSASGTLVNTVTVAAGAGTTDVNPGNNSATDTNQQGTGGGVTEVAGFFAYDPAFLGGVTVAAGDVTGDGIADIITGAGPGGGPHVRAISIVGGTATEVASFFAFDPAFLGGVSVAAGDVTGDGLAEIITGAGAGAGPYVRVFSMVGGTPTEIANFSAYDPAWAGGVSVAAGDVTGDGIAEIITGAGPGGGPHVRAFSLAGGTPTEVASFFAYDPAFPGGVSVAAGDVTGDGVAEIITGAGPRGGPHVRAFSLAGGTPTEVASFFAYDPAFAGGVNVAAGDVTGDGIAEIITGAGPGGGPHVRAINLVGGTPTEVVGFFAYDPAFLGGVWVAARDLTGDGVAEIITGAGPGGGPHVRALDVSGVTVN